MAHAPMRRVNVVGTSGSGKTHLAARLANALDCPHVELDAIHHLREWTPIDTELFRGKVDALTRKPVWVIDGNYSAVQDIVWAQADTVVHLDLPRWRVMRQLTRRTTGRMLRRTRLWNGNVERARNLVSLRREDNILLWAFTTHAGYRRRYAQARQDPTLTHLQFIRLTSFDEIEAFVAGLPVRAD